MRSPLVVAVLALGSCSIADGFQVKRTPLPAPFHAGQKRIWVDPVAQPVSTLGASRDGSAAAVSTSQRRPRGERSLFQSASRRASRAVRTMKRSFTILLASLAFFLSTTQVHSPPAHASSTAISTSSTLSLAKKLNPFRTRSADEMVNAYVRDRLFADDVFDPVESAYREACADAASSKESTGAYPTLLAETAASALGQKRDASSMLSLNAAQSTSASSGKKDGITGVLIKSSDFLQNRLRVSASVSYYLIAGTGLLSLCVLPGSIGVLYQQFQRWQLDKSEMKMYGKVTDMDATAKRITDDDDDDEE